MSDEAWRVFPQFWSRDDAERARALGWGFEPVAGIQRARGHASGRVDFITNSTTWALMWVDDRYSMARVSGNVTPEDYIAEGAARGLPLYEKAWLFYCYLELNGLLAHGEYDEEAPIA